MTTRIEKIMVEQEVPVYIAEDGTEFDTSTACMVYEAQVRASKKQEEERELEEAFRALVVKSVTPNPAFVYDTEIFACKLNSEADYDIVDKWCEMHRCEMDYLSRPKAYPCRYIFSIDSGNYACTEKDGFMDWAKELITVMEEV